MNISKNYNELKREYRQYQEKLFDKCDSQKRPNLQIYAYRQSRIISSKRYTKYFKYNYRKIFKYNQRIANIFITGPQSTKYTWSQKKTKGYKTEGPRYCHKRVRQISEIV